jgi:hypothetical protein
MKAHVLLLNVECAHCVITKAEHIVLIILIHAGNSVDKVAFVNLWSGMLATHTGNKYPSPHSGVRPSDRRKTDVKPDLRSPVPRVDSLLNFGVAPRTQSPS